MSTLLKVKNKKLKKKKMYYKENKYLTLYIFNNN